MEACNELNKSPMHTTLHEVPHPTPTSPNDFRLLNWCIQYNKKNIIIIIILGSLRQKQASKQQTPRMQISCFNYTPQ